MDIHELKYSRADPGDVIYLDWLGNDLDELEEVAVWAQNPAPVTLTGIR